MADTANKALARPAHGSEIDTWDVPMNANSDNIDSAFGASVTINATGASGTNALTEAQYVPRFIIVSGTLTASVVYQFPISVRGQWYVTNSTTGAFTVTFSSADGGTTYAVTQGSRVDLNCDSTGVRVGSAQSGANSDITSLSGLTTPLSVAQGGTSGATAAAARTALDVPGLSTANTFTVRQTLNGSSSSVAALLANAAETATVSATAATGTISYYLNSQSVLYFTSSAAANWTVNLTLSAGTTLNTALSTGQSITAVFLVTQGATAYYNTTVQVDGATSGVTTKWQGAAPTAGIVSSVNIYSYTVLKTGSAAFSVFASMVSFA